MIKIHSVTDRQLCRTRHYQKKGNRAAEKKEKKLYTKEGEKTDKLMHACFGTGGKALPSSDILTKIKSYLKG